MKGTLDHRVQHHERRVHDTPQGDEQDRHEADDGADDQRREERRGRQEHERRRRRQDENPIVMADLVMTSSTVMTWPAGWAGCPYPGCAYVSCP